MAECAAPLGMRLTFGSPLPVEVRHLLDEIVILQQDRAVGADGERVLIAGDWNAGVGCRGLAAVVRHDRASLVFARGGRNTVQVFLSLQPFPPREKRAP